jgi:integrase
VLIWIAIVTGARGELCALRWPHFQSDRRVLHIRRSIAQDGRYLEEKDTKLHQRRHVALDPATTALLVAHHTFREQRAARRGLTLLTDGFIFSPAADGSRCMAPSALGQRYHRFVQRLGITTTVHKLRHYSATELILAHRAGTTRSKTTELHLRNPRDQRRPAGGRQPRRGSQEGAGVPLDLPADWKALVAAKS